MWSTRFPFFLLFLHWLFVALINFLSIQIKNLCCWILMELLHAYMYIIYIYLTLKSYPSINKVRTRKAILYTHFLDRTRITVFESFHRSNHIHFVVFWTIRCYKFWKKKFRKKLEDARNNLIDMHLIHTLKNEFCSDLPLFQSIKV